MPARVGLITCPQQNQVAHAATLPTLAENARMGHPPWKRRTQRSLKVGHPPNQAHLARIRHDHFVPQPAQQATDPRRMRPDFQRDSTAWHCSEDFLQPFRSRANSLFQLYLAGFVQHTVPAVAISQIESDGQLLLRNIPALLRRCGANLLHCRSPFYLCLEHVDNLGAYTASRPETGLLISSDCDN